MSALGRVRRAFTGPEWDEMTEHVPAETPTVEEPEPPAELELDAQAEIPPETGEEEQVPVLEVDEEIPAGAFVFTAEQLDELERTAAEAERLRLQVEEEERLAAEREVAAINRAALMRTLFTPSPRKPRNGNGNGAPTSAPDPTRRQVVDPPPDVSENGHEDERRALLRGLGYYH